MKIVGESERWKHGEGYWGEGWIKTIHEDAYIYDCHNEVWFCITALILMTAEMMRWMKQKKEGENGSENFWKKGLEGEHHQSILDIFMWQ